MSENKTSCGKVRSLDYLHDIFDGSFLSFDTVVNYLNDTIDGFPEIVWRNIGSHSYRNTRCSVYKEIGVTAGKYSGLILCSVEIGNEVYGIFIDVGKKLHGYPGKSRLGISHCRSSVTIH